MVFHGKTADFGRYGTGSHHGGDGWGGVPRNGGTAAGGGGVPGDSGGRSGGPGGGGAPVPQRTVPGGDRRPDGPVHQRLDRAGISSSHQYGQRGGTLAGPRLADPERRLVPGQPLPGSGVLHPYPERIKGRGHPDLDGLGLHPAGRQPHSGVCLFPGGLGPVAGKQQLGGDPGPGRWGGSTYLPLLDDSGRGRSAHRLRAGGDGGGPLGGLRL